MTAWRIATWDRARGVGSIHSPHLGALPFDASVSAFGDYRVGEPVDIQLLHVDGERRVVHIAPHHWRCAVPLASPSPAVARRLAALDEAIRGAYGLAPTAAPDGADFSVAIVTSYFDATHRIDFVAPSYVQLPFAQDAYAWTGASLRTACPALAALCPSLDLEWIEDDHIICLQPFGFDEKAGWVIAEDFRVVAVG